MSGEIELRLKECIKNILGYSDEVLKDLDGNTSILTIGLNSISFIKVIVAIEMEFDIEIDDTSLDFSKFKTLQEMIDLIEQELNKK